MFATVVIPAANETGTIGDVILAAKNSPWVSEVFEKHPELRPGSVRDVGMRLNLGANPPYVLFLLQTATVKRKGTTPDPGQPGAGPKNTGKTGAKGKRKSKQTPPSESDAAPGSDGNKEPQ